MWPRATVDVPIACRGDGWESRARVEGAEVEVLGSCRLPVLVQLRARSITVCRSGGGTFNLGEGDSSASLTFIQGWEIALSPSIMRVQFCAVVVVAIGTVLEPSASPCESVAQADDFFFMP